MPPAHVATSRNSIASINDWIVGGRARAVHPLRHRPSAQHILETKAADFDRLKFEDHYETALVELLKKKKQAGFKPPKGKEALAAPRNVINLMDALRASIKAEKKPTAGAKRSSPAKRRA